MKRDCQHGQLARSCELCEVTAQRDEALAQLAAKSKREATFAELLALGENWDSYGAEPINPEAIDKMREMLEAEWIVPVNDGGVYVSWGDAEQAGFTVRGDLEVEWPEDDWQEEVTQLRVSLASAQERAEKAEALLTREKLTEMVQRIGNGMSVAEQMEISSHDWMLRLRDAILREAGK